MMKPDLDALAKRITAAVTLILAEAFAEPAEAEPPAAPRDVLLDSEWGVEAQALLDRAASEDVTIPVNELSARMNGDTRIELFKRLAVVAEKRPNPEGGNILIGMSR
jgi:hypothetical protein